MATAQEIKQGITQSDLEQIEELTAQNFCAAEIALSLCIDKRLFMHIWRDKKSQVRMAYERGRIQVQSYKQQQLMGQIKKGNITAIQQHDKQEKLRDFEAIKAEVFNL